VPKSAIQIYGLLYSTLHVIYEKTETYTHRQPSYCSMDFVQDNPGKPVPEEIFTHLHLSWSSIVPYLLHPSTMIHGILSVKSTRLTVFFHIEYDHI